MTSLPGFEQTLEDNLQNDLETGLYGGRDNLAHQFLQTVNENIDDYANRHDYALDGVRDSGRVKSRSSGQGSASVTLEWDHPMALFEWGARPHKIEGNPLLSFVWEDPPQWVRESYEREGDGWRVYFPSVSHPGLPEGRMIRGALNKLRFDTQGGRVQL